MQLCIKGGTLIDGTGGHPITDRVILTEGGKIADLIELCRYERIDRGDMVEIDATGRWILPGLINCHDHIFAKSLRRPSPGLNDTDQLNRLVAMRDASLACECIANMLDELEQGVTTIRDMGTPRGISIQLRDAINGGVIPGPRLLVSGRPISMTGGHFQPVSCEADGVSMVRRVARQQLKEGVDFIKLMASGGLSGFPREEPGHAEYTLEELAAATEEAHRRSRKVAAHAQSNAAVKQALRAGVDSIEHGFFLDQEALDLMQAQGVAYVPTLCALHNVGKRARQKGNDALLSLIETELLPAQAKSFRLAAERGIPIGAGTDSTGVMADELAHMVDLGFTEMEAIQAATGRAAQICGIDGETGTIARGKSADLIILDRNPLQDIRSLREIALAIHRGRIYRSTDGCGAG